MIAYLLLCAFMVPVNLWAAMTPHFHTETSMRILHAVSTVVLVPVLLVLWQSRRVVLKALAVVFAVFMVVMVIVNTWITVMGMGVEMGWLDHIFLAVAAASVISFYLIVPDSSVRSKPASSL
ncbi:hypothetical protein [Synechococcus sp. HK01-R]|uniref:hypothetical protein n=1 Tax=Synechococcus sp. HK01-R TaxID=2751171 RepID=UPI00162616D0|nr:hypothetical protein [Synechococcus sp. HK01-R]QNG27114.1 hypothetical protein H0O21_00045 [Synechococcus sp. HK01-R]